MGFDRSPRCDLCPLKGRPQIPPKPATGKVRLAVVLDQPTRHAENRAGHLAGMAGDILARGLRRAGVDPSEAHVTTAALCRADSDRDARMAAACCAPRLLAELADLPAAAPLVLSGREPLSSVTGTTNLATTRGFLLVLPEIELTPPPKKPPAPMTALRRDSLAGRAGLAGRQAIATQAPGMVSRTDLLSPIYYADMARAGRIERGVFAPADQGEHHVGGLEVLAHVKGAVVSCDIETDGVDPLTTSILCIGVSDGETTAVVWPWHDGLAEGFAEWMRTKERVVFHNGFGFDTVVMAAHGVSFEGVRVDDTLLAHHAYASHLPQKLDQVVSEFLDSKAWKIQFGRRGSKVHAKAPVDLPAETLCEYNAADARLTAKAWTAMQGTLAKERAVYEHDLGLAAVCRGMQTAGIGIDSERREEVRAAIVARQEGLLSTLRGIGGDSFQPSKLSDVRRVLFQRLGAKPLKVGDSGVAATDNALLESYRKVDSDLGAFCNALLQWRVADKIRATYIDAIEVRYGRQHPAWKPFGTVSGRLSCRLQSVPRPNPKVPEGRIRELYVPRPGHRFVYFDVSQAEMRLAAYLSADPVFMAACGADLHAGNARNVFPEVAAKGWLDGEALKDPARGKKYRDIAKNLGFAIAYGADAPTVYENLRAKGFPVTLAAVELILAKLRKAYKVYYAFVDANVERVRRTGFMRTPILGRIRWFGHFPKPTEISNFPVQSALADIVNMRMIAMSHRDLGGSPLVAQVHDACIYEVSEAWVDRVVGIIQEMWDEPAQLAGGPLVLPIDLKVGDRWSDL